MYNKEVFIVDSARTAIGKYGGALRDVRPDDMAAGVIKEVVKRNLDDKGISKELIEDVVLGCANQAGEDNRNVARMSVLLAGLPITIPGATVNRLCGTGLEAVIDASRAVAVGDADVV